MLRLSIASAAEARAKSAAGNDGASASAGGAINSRSRQNYASRRGGKIIRKRRRRNSAHHQYRIIACTLVGRSARNKRGVVIKPRALYADLSHLGIMEVSSAPQQNSAWPS